MTTARPSTAVNSLAQRPNKNQINRRHHLAAAQTAWTALFPTNFQFRIAIFDGGATFGSSAGSPRAPPKAVFERSLCIATARNHRKSPAHHTHIIALHASAPALSPATFSNLVRPSVVTLPRRSCIAHGRALAWSLPLGRLRRVPHATGRAAAGQEHPLSIIKHTEPLNSFIRAPNCSVRAATSRTRNRPLSCPPRSSGVVAAAPLTSLLLPPVVRQGCKARAITTESISSDIFCQGDAVLSYRDGQSIVQVTVRSMDAKQ